MCTCALQRVDGFERPFGRAAQPCENLDTYVYIMNIYIHIYNIYMIYTYINTTTI